MQQEHIGADHVAVEITESVLMEASARAEDKLFAYKAAGIEVAIDDFGTGYSSMTYLKRFDIDYLKIDQSFIRNMVQDVTNQTITESTILMAHKLGLKVIAEGVETPEQLHMLKAVGCDFAQGNLFSPARPAAQFERLLIDGLRNSGSLQLH